MDYIVKYERLKHCVDFDLKKDKPLLFTPELFIYLYYGLGRFNKKYGCSFGFLFLISGIYYIYINIDYVQLKYDFKII